MAKKRTTIPNDALLHAPLITTGQLARALGVGIDMIRKGAERAEIEVARMPNNREFFSIEQALSLRDALVNRD
jgi:hypothetical protein